MIPTRRIGELTVSAVGIGCLPLSEGEGLANRERSLQAVHTALDEGITFFDTANIYAPSWDQVGHNELVLAEAFRSYDGDLSGVVIATKGGITRTQAIGGSGGFTRAEGESWGRDASKDALIAACEASLVRLERSTVDLYQLHRHDPNISYAQQVRNLAAVKEAGLTKHIGLSNANLAELNVALEEVGGPADGGIVSVQNEYSPRYREDADVLERCTELGIAFLPWSPLGGSTHAHDAGSRYAEFAAVGDELDVNAQEAVIAWLLAISPVMIPIPGASKPATMRSIAHATTLQLSDEQIDRLSASVPEGTSMYPEGFDRAPLR